MTSSKACFFGVRMCIALENFGVFEVENHFILGVCNCVESKHSNICETFEYMGICKAIGFEHLGTK